MIKKMCQYFPDKRCFHVSCSLIDGSRNISVCALHPNPDGFFIHRKVGRSSVSIFSKGFKARSSR